MKQVPIKLGPLALLLTVISICLTTLAVLAFATARADQRLAAKKTDPADYSLMDLERDAAGNWHTEFREGDAVLLIGFRPSADGHVRIVSWRMEKDWAEDDSLGNLWDGGFSP